MNKTIKLNQEIKFHLTEDNKEVVRKAINQYYLGIDDCNTFDEKLGKLVPVDRKKETEEFKEAHYCINRGEVFNLEIEVDLKTGAIKL